MKKIFVLDTSVCLANANAVYSFGKDDVYIPLKVLEEVDKHKNRQDGVGQNARNFIKILDENLYKEFLLEKFKNERKSQEHQYEIKSWGYPLKLCSLTV